MRAGRAAALAVALLAACAEPPPVAVPLPPLDHLAPEVARDLRALRAEVEGARTGPAWESYGRALFRAGETEAAEVALTHAAALPGSDRPACLHAAGAALRTLAPERAAAHFAAALEAGSTSMSTRLRLAVTLEQTGRPDEAEAHYRAALEEARFVHALLGVGRIALARDDVDGALALLGEAHALDPQMPEVRIALAQALRRAGREGEAAEIAGDVPQFHRATPVVDDYLLEFLNREPAPGRRAGDR